MASAWHFVPTLHVEKALRPLAWGMTDVLRKESKGGRDLGRASQLLDPLCNPCDGTRIGVIVVGQEGCANGFCCPIDHDVGQELILGKSRLNSAAAIAPA